MLKFCGWSWIQYDFNSEIFPIYVWSMHVSWQGPGIIQNWSPFHNLTEQLLPCGITDSHSQGYLVLVKIFFQKLHVMHTGQSCMKAFPQNCCTSSACTVVECWPLGSLIHYSPCGARWENPCREKRTFACWVLRSWHMCDQSPDRKGGKERLLFLTTQNVQKK